MELLQTDEERVKILKALADPARLEIIRVLKDKDKELGCGEVGEHISLSKSTISYHFKALREAGLTTTRKESREKFVTLRYDTFNKYLPGFLDSL
ncbi:ArsR/SmtB family transcription factor [Enterococcus plantarum]|uniref:ArsR/SmtB family transcription factor n=1 Tax=Enterococcus plantarum TaxID=1077675 RepID=UPI001A9046DF|nr:metalloregulator ArsR/SmtB family transcription factor [Enterococcus plantarum]MBO0422310.1 helix-turn-helix transcriptional regulator [Enterococcus plantarum]